MKPLLLLLALSCLPAKAGSSPAPLSSGRYRVLCGEQRKDPPFEVVRFTYGPKAAGRGSRVRWELEVLAKDAPDSAILFELRAETSGDPLAEGDAPLVFDRYVLRVPGAGPPLEYRDAHTGRALLPAWHRFRRYFVPRAVRRARRVGGMPASLKYLGHVLTLRHASRSASWSEWKDVRVLSLDPELLIGTGRVVKDSEGHRLAQTPERQDYSYVRWTWNDYRTMIDAGMNIFGIVPECRRRLLAEPVFHRSGAAGLSFPADLYRSNFAGPVMYLDEPTCILVGDANVHTTLRYFTDAAALIETRVRWQRRLAVHQLERQLKAAGVPLGDMRLEQTDFASWETRYETAFYQFAGGVKGFVHEGRYQLDEFNEFARASTGLDRKYTAEEMFRYHYAFLRGAARHFGGFWGISIYGQADPKLSPLAVRLAYDMGARYIWYWTSDHDHHLPWLEQLALTRLLKKHTREHPRPSIRGPRPALDKAIVIPYGYFLVLESPTKRRNPWDLWWVREMDAEGKNESSKRYRSLMRKALLEVQRSLDAGEEFDITVDDGREVQGYRKVVRLTAD